MSKSKFLLFSLLVITTIFLAACSAGATEGLAVGDLAPNFSLPAADGSSVSLTDYAGQPVLLYFHMAKG
jgi:cytochrome oxidase Cu insertion factor (SCO1/SenC/PrrC family)